MNDTDGNQPASRGDTTREALIRAAIDIIGREGFNAASTRAISEAAGVNQALIGYHFGGKPGLYLASVRFIADNVAARMLPLVESIEAEIDGGAGMGGTDLSRERAVDCLHALIDRFVAMLASDESSAWARVILREQQDPTEGFDILYEGVMHRVLSVTTKLVRHARGRRTTAAAAKLTALAILGQALVFRAARAAVMREMGWQALTAKEVRSIQSEIRRNVAAMLAWEETR